MVSHGDTNDDEEDEFGDTHPSAALGREGKKSATMNGAKGRTSIRLKWLTKSTSPTGGGAIRALLRASDSNVKDGYGMQNACA